MNENTVAPSPNAESTPAPSDLHRLPGFVRKLVPVGRDFMASYKRLERGEQAQLRRDDPKLQAAFWRCANAATKQIENPAHASKAMQVLAAMTPLLSLHESRFGDSCLNVGALLCDQSISQRRVEALLTEKRLEELISSLEGVLRIGKRKIDFGVLLGDLVFFEVNPAAARESWAKALFTHQESNVTTN